VAWSNRARLSGKQIKSMFRMWHRPPRPENPHGVPRSVMKTMQAERLDPNDYNRRLQELLRAYKLNGGG
jgi:hypothetical protein